MTEELDNPFAGTIELNWPGKHCQLLFKDGKWRLIPYGKTTEKRALLFDSRIGENDRNAGYAVKADAMSALESLHSFVPTAVQFIYFDAPRLNVFQSISESGYTTSTWLSLVRQAAQASVPCLKRTGFFAVHTDEQMAHYSRVVLDEVFGSNHYVGTFVWQKQYAPQNDLNIPTDVLDYITVYSKSTADELEKIGLLVTPKDLKDDGDFRGCYIDGHKGARSGSEATKFKVNTSPYHWEIIESNLPEGRYHFDKILGVLWFESVNTIGNYSVKVKAIDKNGREAEKVISFSVREPQDINDAYTLPDRIWWLLKNDNDITANGDLNVAALPESELTAIKGHQFSLVFKAEGGTPFTMRSDSPGANRYWEFGKRTLIEGIAQAKASFGGNGSALPSIKKFFDRDNAKKRQAVMNFLPWYDFGHTQDATQHCKALLNAGITNGAVNMMAKPQRLLGHLVSLLAPNNNDLVMSIGETNGVFASVAAKLNRRFIHITGGSEEDFDTWETTASKRIKATIDGLDKEEIEGNDSLPEAKPKQGHIDVLRLSLSCLIKNSKNGDIEPDFNDSEEIEDFYAGLAGAYKVGNAPYAGMDGRIVVVVSGEDNLDAIMLENIRRQFPSKKIVVVYESMEEEVTAAKQMILRRAPFELI